MYKYFFLIVVLISLTANACNTGKSTNMNTKYSDYNFEKAWVKVDSLRGKGLVKSALNLVEEIYTEADKAEIGGQKVKALFYKGEFTNYVKEDNLESFEKILRKEIDKSSFPDKQLFQSILAEFYDKYLNANQWEIQKRTETTDTLNYDIQTWTIGRFISESNKLYNESILDNRLVDVPYTKYKEIFTETKNTEKLRTNLYDILANRALNHFKNDRNYLPKSTQSFRVNKEEYFSTPKVFTELELKSSDFNDPKYKTLLLFQKLEKSNLKNRDFDELLDVTLKRLEFVNGQYSKSNKQELYLKAIDELIKQYPKEKTTAEVLYKKAEIYKNIGEQNGASKIAKSKWKIKEARDICLNVEKNFPKTPGYRLCKSLRYQIERNVLRVNTEKVNLPNEDLLINIEYKNYKKVFFKLIKLTSKEYEEYKSYDASKTIFLSNLPSIKNWDINLPEDGDFRTHQVEASIPKLDIGIYVLLSSNDSSFLSENGVLGHQIFHVSNLVFWTRADKTNNYVFVVDRKTGKAIENAEVELSYQEWDRGYRERKKIIFLQLMTNSKGYVEFKSSGRSRNFNVVVSKGKDVLEINENIYANKFYPSRKKNSIMFFTDRAIYRPGQIVYYKGIYLSNSSEGIPSILKNKSGLSIEFRDANYQKISESKASTNSFGSFNGSFTIPTSGLTGNMTIKEKSTGTTISIKVEEYKRPKFEVKFNEYKESYKLGDKINITGLVSSFLGFPLQNTKVVYTVKRKVFYRYYFGYYRGFPGNRTNNVEIAHGETVSNNKGEFIVPVELFAKDVNTVDQSPSFNFEITATVVDMTGETHSASKIINASVTKVNISMVLDEEMKEQNESKVIISTTNNSGEKVSAKGKITVYQLIKPDVIFRNRFWSKPDTFIYSKEEFHTKFPYYAFKNEDDKRFWKVLKTEKKFSFNTAEKEEYELNLPVGEYKVVLDFKDPSGKDIKIEKFTSVYSENYNPEQKLLITETDKKSYSPTSAAKIRWQSAISNLHVYYSIWRRDNNVIGKQWLNLSKNKEITIKILEEHRGGVVVSNTYVYNNRFFSDSKTLSVPWSNKELSFEYMSFRSKLYPGQDEVWRIKIKGEKSDEIMSEVLAGMYDASLDKIYTRDWQKSIYYPSVNYSPSRGFGFGSSYYRHQGSDQWRDDEMYYRKAYRRLNWFNFHIRSNRVFMESKVMMRSAKMKGNMVEDGVNMAAAPSSYDEGFGGGDSDKKGDIEVSDKNLAVSNESKDEVQLRTNLNETVFFYPDIVTDENGDFILKFKMNDALTKWKFRMFSHSKGLKFGYDEKEIITQKELMITPNNPRFVREGDELIFKARIDNLTDNSLSGNAWVEIYDGVTMEPLDTKFLKGEKNKGFILDSNGSALVTWKMEFPKNISNLLIYRFYAKAGDFSDAEEGVLPVLTNQKLVTETMPLWVGGKETKDFVFKSLKNSTGKDLENINFTIEATSHPIWLAIQSLPYLKNVTCENSISYTNALFSNLLANKITLENPKIKRVFDRWNNAKSGVDKEALLSNLTKNQELKNILLEDTPWVLDAIDEEEQRRNIALLFDLNEVKSDKDLFIRKLKSLQNVDGGFPWFANGKSNRYITQNIVETFGKMKKLGMLTNERELDKVLERAIYFVNADVVKNYKRLLELSAEGKLDLEKDHLGNLIVHYMYAIQFYPKLKKNSDLQEAYDYYFGQAKKYWLKKSLYTKGMISLVLFRDGESKIAKEILKALDEQSINSEELGRYWKSYHGYHWYQLPIETQALMIEAFDEINNDKKIVDQLKVWLLKNKQTNSWKTDKATVSAIYALLFDNGGTIHEVKNVKVFVDGKDISKSISNNEIQAGTGYFKKKWDKKDIKASLSDIKFVNPNKDIAWGAVYWQYLQDIDKIETFEDTPLKIQRELFLVKNTDKGEVMSKISPKDNLHPGDLVRVKIRLQVDREMEFVHLSDQRAATFEPIEQISGYKWSGGLGYYQNPRDTKMNFFIDFLPRGVFVLEYSLRVTQSGNFSNGISELQSYYAPEFSSHSEGLKVIVK